MSIRLQSYQVKVAIDLHPRPTLQVLQVFRNVFQVFRHLQVQLIKDIGILSLGIRKIKDIGILSIGIRKIKDIGILFIIWLFNPRFGAVQYRHRLHIYFSLTGSGDSWLGCYWEIKFTVIVFPLAGQVLGDYRHFLLYLL